MNNETVLAQRFLADNPGATLVAIDDCVIPAKLLTVSIVTQQRKPLPLLTEFILRTIEAGISDPDALGAFLGFNQDETVPNQIAELVAEGVVLVSKENKVFLTSIGRTRVKELVEIVPEIQQVELLFDQCGWMLSNVSPSEKLSKGRVDAGDLLVLPAKSTGIIDDKLITTDAVIEALGIDQSETRKLDILRIEGVVKRKTRVFIPAKMLVYRSAGELTTRIAVASKGKILPNHERVIADKGGASALGVKITDVKATVEISQEILTELTAISQEQKLSQISAMPDSGTQSSTALRRQVYEIGTFEHWPLLMSALSTAKERLFINSPWISPFVVDDDFLTQFEVMLRRGVITTIGYGFGNDDQRENWESTKKVIRELERLSFNYPNFSFIRHGKTHAKQLIFDQTCVLGSFNWLSFKGDSSREYRQEKSYVVNVPGVADSSYATAIEELVSQGVMRYWQETSVTTSKQHAVSISKIAPGDVFNGKVKNVVKFGVFVELQPEVEGLLHISQTGSESPEELKQDFSENSVIRVRVEEISKESATGKMRYSLTRVFE